MLSLTALALILAETIAAAAAAAEARSSVVISLDGGQWLLAPDAKNVGRAQKWWEQPVAEAKPTKVPWIIQETFVGYHGVAWYWRDFTAPTNPHRAGRYLLRFWAADYMAEVWLNGVQAGAHEGGEDPFVLDVTDAIKPNATNRLAVRVLNPTSEPIEGIVLAETPHRNKTAPYSPGSDFNYGGLTDSVELLLAPPVRVEDLFVRPDPATGLVRVQVNLRNAGQQAASVHVGFTVAPAASGETLDATGFDRQLPPGDTLVEAKLAVAQPRLWDLNDPFLYRVTARVQTGDGASIDEQSTRCGFRDFRFTNGHFRLNGRRLFLRGSHTGADSPMGVRVPYDPDLLRRDLLNVKVMGFNTLRFIAGLARRYQLDLADEIGLLIYEENFASWLLGNSPKMAERFDHSTAGMIKRDRNHPSIVMWGLLNETGDGPVFRQAVASLPLVRALDESRVVMLNSGRFDGCTQSRTIKHPALWRAEFEMVPNVTHNGAGVNLGWDDSTWAPGQLALHPGLAGEYALLRWTAPAAGEYSLAAEFAGLAAKPTTSDIHLFHRDKALFDGFLNLRGKGNTAKFAQALTVQAGDTVDVVVGMGDESPYSDTTALVLNIKSTQGKTYDAAAEFSHQRNPNGVWAYGWLPPGPKADSAKFVLFTKGEANDVQGQTFVAIGSLSNPGSKEWEDVLSDQHPYQRVPHTAPIMNTLRTLSGGRHHVFVSEYGVGSAIDLARLARHYERLGATNCEDARTYRRFLDAFMRDWEQWKLADTFASPEDYFRQCLAKMAGQRLLGINALRANPNVIGYSLTGTMDQGLTAEGLTTTFRELKPGTVDALFEVFYPLRWCLFVEPVNVYRGAAVKLDAVLANEDALPPGEYPARLQVIGPGNARLLDRTIQVRIPARSGETEPPFALAAFSENLTLDGPAGRYRFLAAFGKGGAASGGETEFYVADAAEMPSVNQEVVLWGQDAELAQWLGAHGIRARAFAAGQPSGPEVILVPAKPAGDDAPAWRDLARRIARGASAVFLCPAAFKKGNNAAGWVPLANKGRLANMASWVYLKDEWTKRHPIFDGLPAGGLMDYTFYREVIPDLVWAGQEPPEEVVAGAINTSQGYGAGLLVSVRKLGAGHFILNTLRIRENLGKDPVAERLLRNLLNYAAKQAAQPLADLPADFDEQLGKLGY
jgi:hypothetical protein